jgi:hypothetical protein
MGGLDLAKAPLHFLINDRQDFIAIGLFGVQPRLFQRFERRLVGTFANDPCLVQRVHLLYNETRPLRRAWLSTESVTGKERSVGNHIRRHMHCSRRRQFIHLPKDFFAALGGARVFGEGPGFEKNC